VVSVIGGDGCCLVTTVEDIMGLELGASIIWIIFWVDRVTARVRGSVIDIG
jgi:hypothetical protein